MVVVDYREIHAIVTATVRSVLAVRKGDWRILADLDDAIQNSMIAVYRAITADPAAYGAHGRKQRIAYIRKIATSKAISYARRSAVAGKVLALDGDLAASTTPDDAPLPSAGESKLDIARLAVVVRNARARMTPAEREAFDSIVMEWSPRPAKTRVQIFRLKEAAMAKVKREAAWLV